MIRVHAAPDSARMSRVIVARAVLYLAVEALHAAPHGVRVVDVNVVVLPADWLLHKGLLYLHACIISIDSSAWASNVLLCVSKLVDNQIRG